MLRTLSLAALVLASAAAYAADPAAPAAMPATTTTTTTTTTAPAVAMTEQQKIATLLGSLETSGVTFIRNDVPMTGAEAKKHLEEKLKEVPDVTTARDFLVKVASMSRESGKPYMIKTKEGVTVPAMQWFTPQLQILEGK